MARVGVSGPVRENSGIGVIQREIHARLARDSTLVETPSRDRPGRFGALTGFVAGLLPPLRRTQGYFCSVSPVPFGLRGPVVTIVHDLRWEREGSRAKQAYRGWDLARAVKRSTVLLCVSECTRQDLIARHPEAAESAVAVWLGPGIVGPDAWRAAVPGRVLLVGGAARKRNELAAQVLGHLPPGMVTSAVGIGVSDECRHLLVDLLGSENVEVSGRVSDEEMVKAFQDADYYVHLGTDEGFGLPFVEALKTGTIVVAVDQPLTREVLGDSAILVPGDSAEGMALAWKNATVPSEDVRRERSALFSWDPFEKVVRTTLGLPPSST